MADNIGSVFLEVGVIFKGFDEGLKKAQDKAQQLSNKFQKIGKNLQDFGKKASLAITLPVLGIGTALTKAAIDAEEIESKFATTFRNITGEADATAKNLAESFGLSNTEAQKLLSTTGDLLTGFGFTQQNALQLSDQVQQLAVDLASFNNVEGGASRASDILTKALLGEREALKSLGIVVSEELVKQKLQEKGQQNLTGFALQQAKAVATLELAQEQSKNAIGDFARTSDSAANQLKLLKADTNDLAISLGKILIPIVKDGVTVVRDAVKWFNNLTEGQKQTILTVAGLAAAIGPLSFIIGKTIGVVNKVRDAFKTLTVFLSANPYLALAAGITALVGTVVALTQENKQSADEIKKVVVETKKEQGQLEKLSSEYTTLAEKKDRTRAETARLGEVEKRLGKLYPELNVQLQTNSGAYTKNSKTVSQYVTLKRQEADALVKIKTLQAEEELEKLRKKQEGVNLSIQANLELFQQIEKTDYRATLQKTSAEYKEYIKDNKALFDQVNAAEEEQGKLNKQIKKYEDIVSAANGATINWGDSVTKVKNTFDNTSFSVGKVAEETKELATAQERFNEAAEAIGGAAGAQITAFWDNLKNSIQGVVGVANDIFSKINSIFATLSQNQLTAIENRKQAELDAIESTFNTEKQAIEDSLLSEQDKEDALEQLRQDRADDEKDIIDSIEKEKKKAQKEAAIREKAFAITKAIIDTATAVVEALPNIPLSITAGILGAAQTAAIASQPIPSFQSGGIVPGTQTTGDNVIARVNSREAILNMSQQKRLLDIAEGRIQAPTVNTSSKNFFSIQIGSKVLFKNIEEGIENGDIIVKRVATEAFA